MQTVLNRLVDRGILERTRVGRSFVYEPRLSEAAYLSDTMRRALDGASKGTRRAALAQFVGTLGEEERRAIEQLTQPTDDDEPAGA